MQQAVSSAFLTAGNAILPSQSRRTGLRIPHSIRIRAIKSQLQNQRNEGRWSLEGTTALVTGGTRGIGRAIVEELVGFGARVHTCARNEVELNKCLNDWNASGFEITGSICDVSVPQQRVVMMENVSSIFDGKLNILINNVGTNIRKPMTTFTNAEFSTLIDTNLGSAFHLCQLAYPLLKASDAGSLVFVSSVSGFVSLKLMSVQGATKGAINQLTKNLACEWAEDNIRCNAVAPWYMRTSMVEQVLSNEDYVEEVYSRTPLRRLGDPAEVSSPCCVSLPTSVIIHHWPDYMCGRRNDREWLLSSTQLGRSFNTHHAMD